jgi:hypothetical protein
MEFRKNDLVLKVSFVDYQNDLPVYFVNLFKQNQSNKDLIFTGVMNLKDLILQTKFGIPDLKDLFSDFLKEIW